MAAPRAIGDLGLWLHLRGRAGISGGAARAGATHFPLPPGDGPLLILRPDPASATPGAIRQLREAMAQNSPPPRVMTLGADGAPDIAEDPDACAALITATTPAAVLLLGDGLPAGLIHAASAAGVPLILGDARITAPTGWARGWGIGAGVARRLLQSLHQLLLADAASVEAARTMGVDATRIRLTGPISQIRDPLPCIESERAVMAGMLRRRLVWLAAAIPEAEELAVLDAHRAALRQSHRALLIWVPARPERADPLAEALEAEGFALARRAADQDPTDDVQVLICDDDAEMGLWYRLAPVCYMGGTLSGADDAARHPFEPAALGAAIVHGPQTDAHALEWQQIDGVGAARAVSDAAGLANAIADLAQPDQAARLASAAWAVSTGGAAVAMQIAAPVLTILRGAAGGDAPPTDALAAQAEPGAAR